MLLEDETYMGIDPSLNSSGVVVIDGKGNIKESGAIKPKPKWKHPDKFIYIANELGSIISKYPNLHTVSIEKPFFGPNKLTAQFCMGVWGLMLVVIKRMEPQSIVEIHPNHLKKFVTGNYTAPKERMLLRIFKKWAFEDDCTDIVEAYACAQWGICCAHPENFTVGDAAVVQDYMRLKDVGFVTGNE